MANYVDILDNLEPARGVDVDIISSIPQLELLGRVPSQRPIKYVVKCNLCKDDPELFGDGTFLVDKRSLVKGYMPCGCAKSVRWTEKQYEILVKRTAEKMGYSFVSLLKPFRGQKTKALLSCSKHGQFDKICSNFIFHNTSCRGCVNDSISQTNRKEDSELVEKIRSSGAFHTDTEFRRSDRTSPRGERPYWWVDCAVCGQSTEGILSNLWSGRVPCCGKTTVKTQAYANLIKDGEIDVAIKFGISKDSKSRLQILNQHSSLSLSNLFTYEFENPRNTRLAELECKQALMCGVVDKQAMPDGWSETTYIYNLEKVEQIYRKHGGVKL